MVRTRNGFTLVELMLVLAVAGLLATLAWPSLQSQLTKSRRADATAALQRLALAQARYHAAHGLYTDDPRALGAAAATLSPQGLYRIALAVGPGETYTAVARARADGPQARDTACAEISLRVEMGFAQRGPAPACWTH
jgi:type IV pilus assembly protein PilE